MLNNIETALLKTARVDAKTHGKVAHVVEHTRIIGKLPPASEAARIARWEDLDKAIYRLSSHIERHGRSSADVERFARFVAYLKDSEKIARSSPNRGSERRA